MKNNHLNKILIISYYWPPSGGAGVQRWVKLSKYLAEFPLEIHVLTVNEDKASYMQLDQSIQKDVSTKIHVHKTNSFEPIRLYSKFVGKENVPTAGFSNVNTKSPGSKIINFIRSNIFIPDPRRGWNNYAVKKAASLIQEHGITNVITTSPPHSTQLIGLRLRKQFNIKWISDLRDPWTDIYYYQILQHSFISRWIDARYERKVLKNADIIITVSNQLKNLFKNKDHTIHSEKFLVIPNGFDPEDFKKSIKNADPEKFTICYTGTISDQYEPIDFFQAVKNLISTGTSPKIELKFIGTVAPSILQLIEDIGLIDYFTHVPTVPHDQIVDLQAQSDALLLVIPAVSNAEGILTGKIFEYLASNKAIICIGPENGDAAEIITNCKAGQTFERGKVNEIQNYIHGLIKNSKAEIPFQNDSQKVQEFSRKSQAKKIYKSLFE